MGELAAVIDEFEARKPKLLEATRRELAARIAAQAERVVDRPPGLDDEPLPRARPAHHPPEGESVSDPAFDRTMDLAAMFDASFSLYRRYFVTLIGAVGVIVVPVALLEVAGGPAA